MKRLIQWNYEQPRCHKCERCETIFDCEPCTQAMYLELYSTRQASRDNKRHVEGTLYAEIHHSRGATIKSFICEGCL